MSDEKKRRIEALPVDSTADDSTSKIQIDKEEFRSAFKVLEDSVARDCLEFELHKEKSENLRFQCISAKQDFVTNKEFQEASESMRIAESKLAKAIMAWFPLLKHVKTKTLLVEMLGGSTYTVEVASSTSIEMVKIQIYAKNGTPTRQQRLIYAKKQLEDKDTCELFPDQAKLNLVLRLRGC